MYHPRIFLLLFVFGVVGLGSPAQAFDLTGKKRAGLEAELVTMHEENERLKQDLSILQRENERHASDLTVLKGQLATLEEQVKTAQGKVGECEQRLAVEAKRGSGIKVIFFNGDIIYEIFSDAFVNYKAGIRYRSLADQEFFQKLQSFEQGNGGDFEVLAVLKEIDASNDRMIDDKEALAFRKIAEARFAQKGM